MEENNKPSEEATTVADSLENAPLELAGLPPEVGQMPLFIPQSIDKPLWRYLMSGVLNPKRTTPKVSRYWYEGRLITKDEHDKLSPEQIRASNDVIRSSRLGPRKG
jgi:hypothetical protein